MKDIIITAIIILILLFAAQYIIKAKKSGQKCIGCPYSKECNGKCGEKNTEN